MLYLFDDYELNEQEFSLERNGQRLPLEPRALSLLLVLVENQGRLMEKKALLEAVWKDTYVEETTLTRAIAVIRKTLGDNSRAPRFIETIPTRGYRFIAPVEIRQPDVAPVEPLQQSSISPDSSPDASQIAAAPEVTQQPQSPRVPSRLYAATIAACVCLATLIGLVEYRHHHVPSMSTADTLVLADFNNGSGDPVFDEALRQGMLVQLEQSPVLRLASDGQIRKTLKLMNLPSGARVTSEVGREVCQRIGGNVVLDGSISKLGNEYVISLRGRRCSTGEELDAEQIQIARKEDALSGLTQIATRFRTRIGEASATIKDFDTPLAEATTPSLGALQAFSKGVNTFNTKGSRAALPLFQQAVVTDSQFAAAHVWLGRMYADLGEDTLAIESTQRAYDLRERASERERFSIDVSYDLLVTGNLEKARSTCDAWIQMYPRDVYPRSFLSGLVYPAYGQHERALAEAKASIEIDPDFVVGYRNAATSLIALNRPTEAEQVLAQASQRNLYLASFVTDRYRIAFLRGDADGMKKAADAAPTNPWLLFYQSETFAQAARLTQARVLHEQTLRLAQHGNRRDMEAELLVNAALTNALYGLSDRAASQARSALQLSSGRYVMYAAATALAMTGHTTEAAHVADALTHKFPDDTIVRYSYVPTIRAAIALANKHPQQAIDSLQETAQFELSLPLYPVFLRGEAYLSLGQGSRAAIEFRKIVASPGLVLNDPLLCLAQINLAKADLQVGDKAGAEKALETVLKKWNGADANFSPLQSVQALRIRM